MRTRKFGPVRFHYKKSRLSNFNRVGLLYADVNGGPILRDLPRRWPYINGVFLNSDRLAVLITFRRHVL